MMNNIKRFLHSLGLAKHPNTLKTRYAKLSANYVGILSTLTDIQDELYIAKLELQNATTGKEEAKEIDQEPTKKATRRRRKPAKN